MKKSFIYLDLNTLTGKYFAVCMFVGNVVVFEKALKIGKKYLNKKF